MKLFVTYWSVIIFFTYYLTSAEGKKEYQLNFCFPKVHVLLLTKIVKVRRKRGRERESERERERESEREWSSESWENFNQYKTI